MQTNRHPELTGSRKEVEVGEVQAIKQKVLTVAYHKLLNPKGR